MARRKKKIPEKLVHKTEQERWMDLKEQFRALNKLFTEVENRVMAHGPISAQEVDALCDTIKVSPLGYEVLTEFLKQSPKVLVETHPDASVWIIPNPEYRPGDEDQFPLE